MIDVSGVTHEFPEGARTRCVLDDVTVSLAQDRVGIIGANGSGKSTFVRLINGLIIPTRGTVHVDGLDTRKEAKQVRRLVGFCFTNPDAQIVMPTVREDVAFGLRGRGMSKEEIGQAVDSALVRYGLAGYADHPAHLLSGGEKQLLALASVLVTTPSVLVLDEPTTLLDRRNARTVAAVIETLEQQVILVTHHLDLLVRFDRVLVFDRARLVADGTASEAVRFYEQLIP